MTLPRRPVPVEKNAKLAIATDRLRSWRPASRAVADRHESAAAMSRSGLRLGLRDDRIRFKVRAEPGGTVLAADASGPEAGEHCRRTDDPHATASAEPVRSSAAKR